jgi:protein TonB
MSHDLFVTGGPGSRVRTRQSSLVVASVVVHVAVVAALVVVSILLPGVVPVPRAAGLAWDAGPRLVRLTDIPLPPPPASTRRTTTAAPASAAVASPVPLEAPAGVQADEPASAYSAGAGVPWGVEPGGAASLGDVGGATLEPPPAPMPPRTPVRLHAGIQPPVKIHDLAPLYPAVARSARAEGIVILEATIDTRGDVVAARVLRSVPLLDAAALDAVRQWRYTPARLNGEPVAVVVTVTVNFTLER